LIHGNKDKARCRNSQNFYLSDMKDLENLISRNFPFPVMGEKLDVVNTLPLDFTVANAALAQINLSDTVEFNAFVFEQLAAAGKKYGIGGYFEKRAIYSRSSVFATEAQDFREFHLGVDIWVEAGAAVFAPLEGKVHSFQDNAGFGNYGPTIILEHDLEGQKLYSLYGHLQLADLDFLHEGQLIPKGTQFCRVGPFPENGDWPPHLHFQLMRNLGNFKGDFPGVCAAKDKAYFQSCCPDPNLIIGF
jgi:peptidoglycan LD-endopeptidase LytH